MAIWTVTFYKPGTNISRTREGMTAEQVERFCVICNRLGIAVWATTTPALRLVVEKADDAQDNSDQHRYARMMLSHARVEACRAIGDRWTANLQHHADAALNGPRHQANRIAARNAIARVRRLRAAAWRD